jgi:hypothetical protein
MKLLRKHKYLSLVISIISFSLIHPIVYGNQGLEWGVSIGDRFYFSMEVQTEEGSDSSEFIMEIATLPSIPLEIPSFYHLPVAEADFHFDDNTTTHGFQIGLPFLNTILVGFPIGNWTLLTILMEEFIENLEPSEDIVVENTESYWIITHNAMGAFGIFEYKIVISLLKSDGILAYINYEQWKGSSRSATITITRSNPNNFTIIIVGICVSGIVVIVGAMIYLKRRK